jgi:SAM-dependent methyltransferase
MENVDAVAIQKNAGDYYAEYTPSDEVSLDVFYCYNCQHGQISNKVFDGFYKDYDRPYLNFSFTTLQRGEHKRQLSLLEKYARTKGLLVDIGCDTGAFLEEGGLIFKEIIGIEPSTVACEILKGKSIPYINDYFSKEVFQGRCCDAFFCAQVFEHLSDPLQVLSDLHSVCNEGAVGIIEVPDGQRIWEEKDVPYLIMEHINYWSPASLMRLATKVGFHVQYCNTYDGKNIEILLKKPLVRTKTFSEKRDKLVAFISQLPKDKRISAWGAGVPACDSMAIIEKHIAVSNWYDINPGLHGKYGAGCKTRISKPDAKNIKGDDIILLFNTKYDDQIKDNLRNQYKYDGQILAIP